MIYKFKDYKKRPVLRNHLNMGGENPSGEKISVTSLYFERGGKPWIGVMGEYHFSRDNKENWYKELCKMKAGGVGIVATYLFWIYHEETEGKFNFSGDCDIRKFVEDAKRAGLDVILRIGPWCHGECRNGGFPDWLMEKGFKLRDNNPSYMKKAKIWYEKIFDEVKGLFYKDGGAVIGIQIENELCDKPEHLSELKKMAKKIGFDVPLYTVTGWNSLYGAKIPVNEFVPVFAAYADAPWANSIEKLPPSPHYAFNTERNDTAVGVDIIEKTDKDGWVLPYERYPFATCEIGAGLHPTYHRRTVMSGMDAYAMSLVKLGCGNNLVGYYMYHGGINKIGEKSTFNESRETGYPNDYPVLNYDYQTALSAYGEAREQYGLLNMIHMFVKSFGEILAPMESVEAEKKCREDDFENLRYCMRTDGESGFVFINHYQRNYPLKDVRDVVIDTGNVTFPEIDVTGNVSFIMPFNLKMENDVIVYATVQPLCKCENTYFFAQIPGIEPEFKLESGRVTSSRNFATGNEKVVTVSWEEAKYLRELDGEIYIGEGCNLYKEMGVLKSIENGGISYREYNGENFDYYMDESDFEEAEAFFTSCEEPFVPQYLKELSIGGEGGRKWKKIYASSPAGFIEIGYSYSIAQIYVDKKLVADNYYTGKMWRIPANLVYGREAYLVMSEKKDGIYTER